MNPWSTRGSFRWNHVPAPRLCLCNPCFENHCSESHWESLCTYSSSRLQSETWTPRCWFLPPTAASSFTGPSRVSKFHQVNKCPCIAHCAGHMVAHAYYCTWTCLHSAHAHALPAHCPCSNRKTCLLWTDLLQEITSCLHLIYVDHCWWQ